MGDMEDIQRYFGSQSTTAPVKKKKTTADNELDSINAYLGGKQPETKKQVGVLDQAWNVAKTAVQNIPSNLQHMAGGQLQSVGETSQIGDIVPPQDFQKRLEDSDKQRRKDSGQKVPSDLYYRFSPEWQKQLDAAWQSELAQRRQTPGTQEYKTAQISQPIAETGQRLSTTATQNIQQVKQQNNIAPGSASDIVANTIGGLVETAPALAATVFTKNAAPLLGYTGASSFGNTYASNRESGASPLDSLGSATGSATIDVVMNKMPVNMLLKPSKNILKAALIQTVGQGGLNAVGETMKVALDKGIVNPDMTFNEAWNRIKNSAISGSISGGVMSLATHPFVSQGGENNGQLQTEVQGRQAEVNPQQQATDVQTTQPQRYNTIEDIAPEFTHQNTVFGQIQRENYTPDPWKIHITATPENMVDVYNLARPILDQYNVTHKITRSADALNSMAGTQTGKFLTIYPRNAQEAVQIANQLDAVYKQSGLSGPNIVTDRPVGDSGMVFARHDGAARDSGQYKPANVPDIFEQPQQPVQQQPTQQGAELSPNLDRMINTNREMIPKGEQPRVNDVEIPKQTEFGKTRQFSRTAAEILPDPEPVLKDVESGKLAYEPISNKQTIATAETKVNDSFDSSYQQWKATVNGKQRITADDIALGEALLIRAARDKNAPLVSELTLDLATELTNAGQVVQAARLLKRMSPEGYQMYIDKSIAKINKEAQQRYGDKAPNIKLTDAERQAILDAPTSEARDKVGMEIAQRIADEMPTSFTEKFNAWRRIAMLFNPKTHIRNIVGNAIFIPMRKAADAISMGLEKAFKVPVSERTKSFGWNKDPKIVKTVNGVWDEVGQSLIDNRRWDVASQVLGRDKRIFKTNWLERLNKFSGKTLEAEDVWFLERAFKDELGQVMKSRNIRKPNEQAIIYASRRALEATYRDASALAKMIRDAKNDGGLKGVLLEGLMPFEKTPINIAKRGIEYSPIGAMRGLINLFGKVRRGTMPATEAIERMAQGATGTGVLALGVLLAKMGIITGAPDEDRDKAAYEKSVGKQPFAVHIGNQYYTWDWAQPVSIPIAMGAQVYQSIKDKTSLVDSVINSTEAGIDSVLNLPLFQGVKQTIKGYAYNSDKGSQFLSGALTDLMTSYVEQAFPTVGGQIARTIDPTIRTTYTAKHGKDLPSMLGQNAEKFGRYAMNRTPGATYALPPRTDVFGNEVKQSPNVLARAAQNFISPGFLTEYKDTPASHLIERVYDDTGEKGIFPGEAPKWIVYNKNKIYLDANERNQVQKYMGDYVVKRFNDLAQDGAFSKKRPDTQARIMKNIVDTASRSARYWFVKEVRNK